MAYHRCDSYSPMPWDVKLSPEKQVSSEAFAFKTTARRDGSCFAARMLSEDLRRGKSNASVKKTNIEQGDLIASSLMAAGQSENASWIALLLH